MSIHRSECTTTARSHAARSRWIHRLMSLARALLISVAAAFLSGCCSGEKVHLKGDGGFQAIDGSVVHPLQRLDNGAVVLIFITTDCPISNGYAPEINNLAERCGPGVETWGTS